MPTAQHQPGVAIKFSAPAFLARVVGDDGEVLGQSDVSAAAYSIVRLDPDDPDSETAVTGHTAQTLDVSDCISDDLQVDETWKNDDGDYVDSQGYNFRFQPDIGTSQAFAVAGATYLVRVTLTPSSGQPIVFAWKVRCI